MIKKNSIFQILAISLVLAACGSDGGDDSSDGSSDDSSDDSSIDSIIDSGGDGDTETNTNTNDLSGPPTGTLTWTIPTARTDGSPLPLSDIASYQLCYFINDSSENCEIIKIDDPSQDSYFLGNLEQGNYLITLAVIDKNGVFSEKSEVLKYLVE